MAGIVFNVIADEDRDFPLELIWYDKNDARVDLTGWGALCEVRKLSDNSLVSRVTHDDNIILSTSAGNEGEITLTIPAADLNTDDDCQYELILHPTAADPTTNPVTLVRGLFTIRTAIASLSPP